MQKGMYCIFLLSGFCLWLLAACGSSGNEQKIAAGKEIYLSQCSHCHQPEGQGYAQVYPRLAGNPIVLLDDPAPTIEIVMNGRGSMPPFRDELTVEERAQVISYVRAAWGNNASTISIMQAN
jgi:mono/diheme cytochrome c family protein